MFYDNGKYDEMHKGNVKPLKPTFSSLYVDDGFSGRKKADTDVIGEALNGFHPTLNFTAETEPKKFLDSEFHKDV